MFLRKSFFVEHINSLAQFSWFLKQCTRAKQPYSPRVRIGTYSDETAKVKKLEIGHVDVSHETDMRLLEGTKKASLSVRAI
jgi:hypothetical protein